MTLADASRTSFQLAWWIKAPPDRVFGAWTKPSELGWFYNDAMPVPDEPIEVDLRVGGAWRLMMVIDASTRYFTGGVYREIVPNQKLVFAWGAVDGWPEIDLERLDDAPLATVNFAPVDGGTKLIVDVEIPAGMSTADARERLLRAMRSGWRDTVDRLQLKYSPIDVAG
jgi:uncharacterized protein YndB with AHSA1/START domain